MSRTRSMTLGVAAGSAVTLLALSTGPAAAGDTRTVVVQGSASHVEQELGECLDVEFPIRHDADFHAAFQERRQHGQIHFSIRFWNRNTFTNEESGATMSGRSRGHEVERRITENPDGTLTISVELHSRASYRTSPGGLIGILSTSQTLDVVIDTMGTPLDLEDDVVLSEVWSEPVVRVVGDGGDLCDVAAAYLS